MMPSLFITNKCDFECEHCLFCSSPRRNQHMSLSTLYHICSKFEGHSFNIVGGEPTLHPDFLYILKESMIAASDVRIVTNGNWFYTGEEYEFPEYTEEDDEYYDYYDLLSEEESIVYYVSEGSVTKKAFEVLSGIYDIVYATDTDLVIHLSNDIYHNVFLNTGKVKQLFHLLRDFEVPRLSISIDNNNAPRTVFPLGRGRRCYTEIKSIVCDNAYLCDSPSDLPCCMNILPSGKISLCESGLYKFADVNIHSLDEIKERMMKTHRYINNILQDNKHLHPVDQCFKCQDMHKEYVKKCLNSRNI